MNMKSGAGCLFIVGIVGLCITALILVLLSGDMNETVKPDESQPDCGPKVHISNVIDVKNLPDKKIKGYGEDQLKNAAVIINEARKADVDRQGAVIGLMTAMQESSLRILANGGDWEYPKNTSIMTYEQWLKARDIVMKSLDYPHEGVGNAWDALGILQQRPSAGWGSVKEIMNPSYAASAFYERLVKVPNWRDKPYELAAEAVQISGKPDNYADHRTNAESIFDALQGAKVESSESDSNSTQCEDGTPKDEKYDGPKGEWVFPVKTVSTIQYNYGEPRGAYPHAGEDFSSPEDTPIYAASGGQVIRSSCSDLVVGRSPCQIQVDHGKVDGVRISTLYVHMFPDDLKANVGDVVKPGQKIAQVGTNGQSTGFHLHFEVWLGKKQTNPVNFLKEHGVKIPG
ncbi:UNVERIFIED_CONTAM: M23 family metallopeptidase [Actinomycetes bacterium ARC8]|nr:M23 family metallopeptidase [Actinomycetes bacterium ARC8]